jgi:hypothetical protein
MRRILAYLLTNGFVSDGESRFRGQQRNEIAAAGL